MDQTGKEVARYGFQDGNPHGEWRIRTAQEDITLSFEDGRFLRCSRVSTSNPVSRD